MRSEEKIKLRKFASYQAIFARAVELVNQGSSVDRAVEEACRSLYPYTYRDILPVLKRLHLLVKRERGLGDLRALRALAEQIEIAKYCRKVHTAVEERQSNLEPPRTRVVANYSLIFKTASKKVRTGFSPEDALEMACHELYPHTAKKVLHQALFYLHYVERKEEVSGSWVLKYLAEDSSILREIEELIPE